MNGIRACDAQDSSEILAIINAAAEAYRGVIPPDCWHEPYFTEAHLREEVADGIKFSGCLVDGALVGVMGLQSVADVELIRHAYVLPAFQRDGIGTRLLEHLQESTTRRVLIGTWAAAHRAIDFYRRNNFEVLPRDEATTLLNRYWNVSPRQIEVSVVLEKRGF